MKQILFTEVEKLEYGRYEAMNSLMTNVQYSGEDIKSIIITSCAPDVGKSTISFDLARAFADNGNKTIILDMDFRKTVMLSRYKVNLQGQKIFGMIHLLSGKVKPSEVICETNIPNLYVAFTGGYSANPTGLLNSTIFQPLIDVLKKQYDMIIVDTPPIGVVIDAAIIAPKVDGAVLVVAYDQTTRTQAIAAKKQLEASGCNMLGVVMNKVPMTKNGDYYKYYGEYK